VRVSALTNKWVRFFISMPSFFPCLFNESSIIRVSANLQNLHAISLAHSPSGTINTLNFFGRLSLRRATLGGSLIVPSEIARLISKTLPTKATRALRHFHAALIYCLVIFLYAQLSFCSGISALGYSPSMIICVMKFHFLCIICQRKCFGVLIHMYMYFVSLNPPRETVVQQKQICAV
jgi:hypothetical protein